MKDSTSTIPVRSPVLEAITSRKSVRAFLPKPVDPALLDELLLAAGMAPSGSNVQPWQVHVVSGAARDRLSAALLAAHEAGQPAEREYQYYPLTWRTPYIERRRATGWGLYNLLGIEKGDREAASRQHGRNYEFFDAPVVLVFTIDKDLQTGSWLDYGMFLQNIMLAARARGLHTCPQAAWNTFASVVLPHVGAGADEMLVCGMSLGWADEAAPVNSFFTPREPLEVFTQWLE